MSGLFLGVGDDRTSSLLGHLHQFRALHHLLSLRTRGGDDLIAFGLDPGEEVLPFLQQPTSCTQLLGECLCRSLQHGEHLVLADHG